MKNANPQLVALRNIGQSVWYDNLSRDVLKTGELKSLIDAGVLGLTSNPAIFKKSIADSSDYDDAIKVLKSKGVTDADTVTETLMVEDVANAADLLLPIYKETNGVDGCASIEVSPFLADDTQGTIASGKKLWAALNRPNIMIKVPATPAGIPAITALLAEGINVNVTLIFSCEVYETVMDAYLSGVEQCLAKGGNVSKLASVASFFVSRVDSISESTLGALLKDGKITQADFDRYFGNVGIANSKLAYKAYENKFSSPRFAALKQKGAIVQRPLWASTGTKNPKFSPVMYVEALAGKDTVNTMPPATLTALMQNATIRNALSSGYEESKSLIDSLSGLGVNFGKLLVDLQTQGVKLFADAYTDLLKAVTDKVAKV
jgi:transaldolase/glucose-6-phosphate isomerase